MGCSLKTYWIIYLNINTHLFIAEFWLDFIFTGRLEGTIWELLCARALDNPLFESSLDGLETA